MPQINYNLRLDLFSGNPFKKHLKEIQERQGNHSMCLNGPNITFWAKQNISLMSLMKKMLHP